MRRFDQYLDQELEKLEKEKQGIGGFRVFQGSHKLHVLKSRGGSPTNRRHEGWWDGDHTSLSPKISCVNMRPAGRIRPKSHDFTYRGPEYSEAARRMHEDLSRNPILNPQSRAERPHTASPRAHLVTSIHGEGPVLEPRRMKVQAVSRDPILEGGVDNGKPMKKAVPSYEYLTKLRQEGRPYGIRTKDHISTEGCAGETSRNINAKVAWSQHFDNFKQIRSSSHTIRPVEGQEQQMKPTTKLSVFSEKLKITSRDPIVQPKSQFPTPPVKINNYRRKILHKAFDRSGPEKEVQWKSSVHITQHNKPSSIAQLHGKEGSDRDKRLMRSKVRTYEKTNSYNSSKDVYEYSHSGALGNPRRFERRAEYKRVHEEQLHRHQPTSLAMDRQQHMRSSMNIFHHVGQEK